MWQPGRHVSLVGPGGDGDGPGRGRRRPDDRLPHVVQPGLVAAPQFWELPPAGGPIVAASARLIVEAAPPVDELYFWALQASFTDGSGRRARRRPPGPAVARRRTRAPAPPTGAATRPAAAILPGSESALPSAHRQRQHPRPGGSRACPTALDDRAGAPAAGLGRARSTAPSCARLAAGGDRLDGLMVWSEVFARCDDPPVAVRWSGFAATVADRRGPLARRPCAVNYQARGRRRLRQHDGRGRRRRRRQLTGHAALRSRRDPPAARLSAPSSACRASRCSRLGFSVIVTLFILSPRRDLGRELEARGDVAEQVVAPCRACRCSRRCR